MEEGSSPHLVAANMRGLVDLDLIQPACLHQGLQLPGSCPADYPAARVPAGMRADKEQKAFHFLLLGLQNTCAVYLDWSRWARCTLPLHRAICFFNDCPYGQRTLLPDCLVECEKSILHSLLRSAGRG